MKKKERKIVFVLDSVSSKVHRKEMNLLMFLGFKIQIKLKIDIQTQAIEAIVQRQRII